MSLHRFLQTLFMVASAGLGQLAFASTLIVEGVIIHKSETWTTAPTGQYELEIAQVVHGQLGWSTIFIRAVQEPAELAPRKLPQAELALEVGDSIYAVLRPAPEGLYEVLSWRRLASGTDDVTDNLPLLGGTTATPSSKLGGLKSASGSAPTPTFEERVVELVNEERWSDSMLPPLKANTLLDDSSLTHSTNMAQRDFFAHCDPDTNTQARDRMSAAGYSYNYAAENIAAGSSTPDSVMVGWMNSPDHRLNILDTAWREIGVGYFHQMDDLSGVSFWEYDSQNETCTADGNSGNPFFHYWTQNFGSRNSVYPVVIDREAVVTNNSTVDLYVYGAGWAQDMRFSNDGVSYSAWQPYTPDKSWDLSTGNGTKTVYAQLRNSGTVRQSVDQIYLDGTCDAYSVSLELTHQTIAGADEQIACEWIRAGDNFRVNASGDLTLRAGNQLILRDGFSVAAGGSFRAIIDPSL